MSDSGDYTPEQTWTPTKGQTQGAFDPTQVAWSAAPNYEGMPTEYYDKNGQLIGYLGKGDKVMPTAGLNYVDAYGKPVGAPTDKHSLFQMTDENGNLLYQNTSDVGPTYTTQNTGAPATWQLSGLINKNAPSPGILQDPLFRNFLISSAAMGAGAVLAPAAGAAAPVAEAFPVELGAAIPATELGALGTAAGAGAGALTGAQALQYAKMGLSGLGLASQIAGLTGLGGSGQGGSQGGGSGLGGTTNVYNSSGPWNTPLKPEVMTVGQASQRPITSGLENLEMLAPTIDPSFGKPPVESSIPQQNYFTYGSPVQTTYPTTVPPAYKNGGGVLQTFKDGDQPHVPEFITGTTGHYVKGRGDGQSDDIPAMLADGEYVFDSSAVSTLGNGSSDAGAKLLDAFRESLREHTRSAPSDKIPPKASPLEYMKTAMKKVGTK